jgi:hypothetical protein
MRVMHMLSLLYASAVKPAIHVLAVATHAELMGSSIILAMVQQMLLLPLLQLAHYAPQARNQQTRGLTASFQAFGKVILRLSRALLLATYARVVGCKIGVTVAGCSVAFATERCPLHWLRNTGTIMV